MRLGKKKEKEKDTEPRSQNVEGVSRLICSARASHNMPLRGEFITRFCQYLSFLMFLTVYIDGVEFNGVKFFQLNSTWQTHLKQLPVALVGVPLVESNSL